MSFRARLRPLKRALALAFEWTWVHAMGALATLRRSKARRWHCPGGQRVLVVAPHPDDEVIGCAGAILLHVAAGDRVCVAVATDGRRSRTVSDANAMAALRRREAEAAAHILGIQELEWLGLPEGEWSTSTLTELLSALLTRLAPDVVYAPSRIDFHPEHRHVAHALALSLSAAGTKTAIRIFPIQVPLASRLSNLVADVSALPAQCAAAVAAYASQAGSLGSGLRRRRYSARLHHVKGHAEDFWELDCPGYVELHATLPDSWPDAFRGLRSFPATDPLAYLVGARERRRLASIVEARTLRK
jgi:LmbE family N-acetylglucosaminyl deacetylase